MDAQPTTKGENGDAAFTAQAVKRPLLALFFQLVRGMGKEQMDSLLAPCLDVDSDAELLDVFLLMANTRGVRSGKGERALFFDMFWKVGERFPNQCVDMLNLVPDIGSFRDLKVLFNESLARIHALEVKRLEAKKGEKLKGSQSSGRNREKMTPCKKVPTTAATNCPTKGEEVAFLWSVAAECVRIFSEHLEADSATLEAHLAQKRMEEEAGCGLEQLFENDLENGRDHGARLDGEKNPDATEILERDSGNVPTSNWFDDPLVPKEDVRDRYKKKSPRRDRRAEKNANADGNATSVVVVEELFHGMTHKEAARSIYKKHHRKRKRTYQSKEPAQNLANSTTNKAKNQMHNRRGSWIDAKKNLRRQQRRRVQRDAALQNLSIYEAREDFDQREGVDSFAMDTYSGLMR